MAAARERRRRARAPAAAVVTASFAIEAWGADGLLAATATGPTLQALRPGPRRGAVVRPERCDDRPSEVARALAAHRGVVALETTVVTHGLPYPQGLEVAASMEACVAARCAAGHDRRARGPHRGGLTRAELERLASSPTCRS
jgi:hypothetical protein